MSAESWTAPNSDYPSPKQDEPALYAAARTGDHDAIRRLIAGGEDIEHVFNMALDTEAPKQPATPRGVHKRRLRIQLHLFEVL